MATTIGTLNVQFSANASGFQQGASSVVSSMKTIESSTNGLLQKLAALTGGYIALNKAFDVAKFGVSMASATEDAQASFEAMLGSASKASSHLAELQAIADKSPYGRQALREASQTMVSFGVDADESASIMRRLGDIAGGSEQKLKSLALVYGQVTANQKLMGNDVLQFIGGGFNPLAQMEQDTGISMMRLRKMMEQGAISIDDVRLAIVNATSEGGIHFGRMEKASQTLSGRWSTLKDNASSLAENVSGSLVPALKMLVEGLNYSAIGWSIMLGFGMPKEATAKVKEHAGAYKVLGQSAREAAEQSIAAAQKQLKAIHESAKGTNKAIRETIERVEQGIDKTKSKYQRMRDSLSGGGSSRFSSAADRFSAEGFAAVQMGREQGKILVALEAMREEETRELKIANERLKRLQTILERSERTIKEFKI